MKLIIAKYLDTWPKPVSIMKCLGLLVFSYAIPWKYSSLD